MELTVEQLQEDIAFLLSRSDEAGSCDFTSERWTGTSSNSLVRFAYGGKHKFMPSDRSDFSACVLTVKRLPKHRRTPAVMAALWEAKRHYLLRYPENSLERRARRLEWEEKRRQRYEREQRNWERRQKRRRA